MKPQRLPPAQTRNQTRERLLAAAYRVFLKKGYVSASVVDITATAGFTRGAFYSNYRSKSELLLELLERNRASVMTRFEANFDESLTPGQAATMALVHFRKLLADDECAQLWGEAKLQAARDTAFRVRFNQLLHRKWLQMAEFIQCFAEQSRTAPLLPVETLAVGLICLCDGVQSYYTVDSAHVPADVADLMLAGLFARIA
ncbi:TetR/AcrR family transcriptional regulator [Burkholderia stabilis]|uniref:TetR/AcrR family transcriptional regulator n=1 Tax=Burkholderia stabilis TaxID=95485 RepID=A0A4Q2A750_9BURK|nr:TetR/AcrR family transcriptional regulator [Burkholderia stabilis]RXV65027.1 TetR/AcrR family transcriptional regulator [Burkholderia stabilis]